MKETVAPKSPLLLATIQLGLLIFAVYYTFIGGHTAQGIFDHHWRLITLWLTTIVIGVWLLWRLLSSHKIPRTPLDFPLLFLLGSWLLATVFSVNPVYSRETLVFFITYLFFFYLAADLGRRLWFTELVFNAIIGVSGLVWMLALLQLSGWYRQLAPAPALLPAGFGVTESLPRLSVLGNPNTMAGYIALVLPIVIYKLTTVTKPASRILLGLWVVMLSGAGLLTQSRGGVLALIVAVGFYVAVWTIQKAGGTATGLSLNVVVPKLDPKAHKAMRPLALAGVGFLGFFVWLIFKFRGLSPGVELRKQVMAGAVKTLLHHPLVGSGPGTLGEALIRYQKPLDVIWSDAHNLPLTVIAETGLIGAVALAWLGVAGFKILRSTLRQADGSQWQMSSMACAAALLGFAAHNMVDSLFKFPLLMMLVAVWAGFWLSPYLSSANSTAKFWGYPVMAVAVGVLVATVRVGVSDVQNIAAYNQAVEATEQDDWLAGVNHLQTAVRLAPELPFYRRQLGFVAGYLSEREPAYRPEAVAHYQAALSKLDQLPVDHANLACLLWADNRRAESQEEMALAQALEPGNLLYRLNLGYYFELTGNEQAAWGEYAQVLAERPDYLQSSYWQQTEARAQALPEIVAGTAQSLVEAAEPNWDKLIELQLYAHNTEAARQAYDASLRHTAPTAPAESHPAVGRLSKGRILLAMGHLAEAEVEFEATLRVEPGTGEAYLGLSKIALAQGELDKATKYVEVALFLAENPDAHDQAAQVAEARRDDSTAIEHYDAAFAQLTAQTDYNLTRYATEVARRRPLPSGHLPCLLRIYPTPLLENVTLAEGSLLEKQGNYLRAGQVYRRLLSYEPASSLIEAKLEILCRDHPEACQN